MSRILRLVVGGIAGLGLGLGLGISGAVDVVDDAAVELAAAQVSFYDCPAGNELGTLRRGDEVLLTAQDASGLWVQLRSPLDVTNRAWVRQAATVPDASVAGLPVQSCEPEVAASPSTTFACAPQWVLDPPASQFNAAAVRITAEGFTPNSPIAIRLGDSDPFAQLLSDETGAFDGFVNLPDIVEGDYVLIGEDNNGCSIAEPYTIERTRPIGQCDSPEFTLSPLGAHFVGGSVHVTGHGFTPNGSVTVHLTMEPFDGTQPSFDEIPTDAGGQIDGFVTIPDVAEGDYTFGLADTVDPGCRIIHFPYVVSRTDTTTTVAADSTAPTISSVVWTLPVIEEFPESGAPACPGAPQTIVQASVTDSGGLASVRLTYEVGIVSRTVDMNLAGGTYNGGVGPFDHETITGFGNSETIILTIRATDNSGNTAVFSPSGGPVLNNCGTT